MGFLGFFCEKCQVLSPLDAAEKRSNDVYAFAWGSGFRSLVGVMSGILAFKDCRGWFVCCSPFCLEDESSPPMEVDEVWRSRALWGGRDMVEMTGRQVLQLCV